jgi:hypothetical protein
VRNHPAKPLKAGADFRALLAALREIGRTVWDPIGISDLRADCEDEYDNYLLVAAGKLSSGSSEDKVADYLVDIECNHMGLQIRPGMRERALTLTRRIDALLSDPA